jgi:site-specific DNA recombinase
VKAIGYVRVSTARQAREGLSLDEQRARIEAWATANGHELLAIEVDAGLSGGKASNRPALQRALDLACKEGAVLVAYNLSRFARSVPDALSILKRLKAAGAGLASLSESLDTSTAMGQFVYTVLAAVAQLHRDITAEQARDVTRYKRDRGEHAGGQAPFGYSVSRATEKPSLVPNEDEQVVLRMIHRLRAEGLGAARIARRLNKARVPCRGSAWHPTSVQRALGRVTRATENLRPALSGNLDANRGLAG